MSWSPRLAAAGLALLVAGCGFQLRGQFSIPAELQPIHIKARGNSRVAVELREILRRNEVSLAGEAAAAASELEILDERRQRRVLTISATSADVDEYELRHTTTWVLRDTGEQRRPLTGVETIEALRDYTFDRTAVLAKQSEEASLVRDMEQDAAIRILYRLQAWRPSQIPAPEDVEVQQEVEEGG